VIFGKEVTKLQQFPVWQRNPVFCPLANEFTRNVALNWSQKTHLRRKNRVSKAAPGNIRSNRELLTKLRGK
jgi:hypothetical protein